MCVYAEEYGGAGGDFAKEQAALIYAQSEANQAGFGGFFLHSGIGAFISGIMGTEAQKQAWLPKMATGEMIMLIMMTEPGTASLIYRISRPMQSKKDDYIYQWLKDLYNQWSTSVILTHWFGLAKKTDREKGAQGVSLIVAETDNAPGFERGKN
jgi:alkylation response protein AidB-like acyl-CoA dehydrogenase